jgi:hypothetical protein
VPVNIHFDHASEAQEGDAGMGASQTKQPQMSPFLMDADIFVTRPHPTDHLSSSELLDKAQYAADAAGVLAATVWVKRHNNCVFAIPVQLRELAIHLDELLALRAAEDLAELVPNDFEHLVRIPTIDFIRAKILAKVIGLLAEIQKVAGNLGVGLQSAECVTQSEQELRVRKRPQVAELPTDLIYGEVLHGEGGDTTGVPSPEGGTLRRLG